MEVSHVNDHVTHAVIGGQQAINFTVADSAELMNVLSKALYTDQELAVTRETLCNAWDAHIEAGISDKPFIITLTPDELIIRDYGHGIPHHMIGPIYGTYGGSTKKENINVTGGFGLGCKSPFAYGDHFEVTSWNGGMMTVYNLSKSSAEVQGKPGIIPIVSVPTTETGLQVKIKLNKPSDERRFERLIRRIVQNGEMNCIFNGELLEKLPFNRAVHNFIVTSKKLIETNHTILLRYGHVIYPIENNLAFKKQYDKVNSILSKIPYRDYRGYMEYKIVFQAPPNTISITPSREALSMQEGTIKTVGKLLNDFITLADERLEKGCFDLLKTSIESVWLNSAPKALFGNKSSIPNLKRQETTETTMVDFDEFISRYASYSYPDYPNFAQKDQISRIEALIDAGFGDQTLNQEYKKRLKLGFSKEKPVDLETPNEWFKNHILTPLTKDLLKNPDMNVDKLFLYTNQKTTRYGCELKPFTFKDLGSKTLFEFFPWLRKIVILSHNKLDFGYRAENFPIMKYWLGPVEDTFLYTVARSPKKVQAAREFFKSKGYTILDLTVAQPWETSDAAAPVQKEYVSQPKRKGIPTLESCLVPDTMNIDMTLPSKEEKQLIEIPEFILKANYKTNGSGTLPNSSASVSRFIIKKWGKLGGFVVNSNQEAKYVSMGAALYEDFILDKIYEEFTTNPRIIESLPFIFERSKIITESFYGRKMYERERQFLSAVYIDPDLIEYFGLVHTMTDEDKLFWKMWLEFKKEHRTGSKDTFTKIEEYLEPIQVDEKVIHLFNQIKNSKLLFAFESEETLALMTSLKKPGRYNISSNQFILLRDMLLQAIEG